MFQPPTTTAFNRAFGETFREGRLTFGVFFPIEAFAGSAPAMTGQVELARRAEQLGFRALWFRDVPLLDPDFGDVGQVFDPWVYLGYIAAQTRTIHLATGSIILPLRHPLHTAKAAASVNELTGGRLILGVASGDRMIEYPAFGVNFGTRGEHFRLACDDIRRALYESFPHIDSPLTHLSGADLVPKPASGRIPLLVTGNSQQSLDWVAAQADGWLYYPRDPAPQAARIAEWRQYCARHAPGIFKPFAQSLYVNIVANADTPPSRIHLGYRLGRRALVELLAGLRDLGVNHVAFNLKYGERPAAEVLEELGNEVLPHFAPADAASATDTEDELRTLPAARH
jgi:luciferase-type oxidoreductase